MVKDQNPIHQHVLQLLEQLENVRHQWPDFKQLPVVQDVHTIEKEFPPLVLNVVKALESVHHRSYWFAVYTALRSDLARSFLLWRFSEVAWPKSNDTMFHVAQTARFHDDLLDTVCDTILAPRPSLSKLNVDSLTHGWPFSYEKKAWFYSVYWNYVHKLLHNHKPSNQVNEVPWILQSRSGRTVDIAKQVNEANIMSPVFSLVSRRMFRRACEQFGLHGKLSLTQADRILLRTYKINDNFHFVEYKTLNFSVDNLEGNTLGEGFFLQAFKGQDEHGISWVVKKPRTSEEIAFLPTDITNQHLAFKLSQFFSDQVCRQSFDNSAYVRYMCPLLGSAEIFFKDGRRKKLDVCFEVEKFIPGDYTIFNSPNGPTQRLLDAGKLLCQVFSRWTHDVTEGRAMICGLEGCKMGKRMYLCTDAIVFNQGNRMDNFRAQYKNLLTENPSLRCLDSNPCFQPTANQKDQMIDLVQKLARLANKPIARKIQSKVQVRPRARSRTYSF